MKQTKIILLTLLALLAMSSLVLAAKPGVSSDKSYLDINTGRYILEGHVKITTDSRTITADKAQVDIASLEVWAQGNIQVVQDGLTFHGDKVHVMSSKKTAEIEGHADL